MLYKPNKQKSMITVKTTVGGIISRTQHEKVEILLTRRNVEPFKHMWCIPGGHIELYENAVAAVIREIKEETNLDFRPVFLTYVDEIFEDRQIHNVVLLFYGETSNELIPSPDEVSEAGWFSLEEALKMDLAFNHHEALEFFKDRFSLNNIP
ncbi:MAG: NUDIX hydrolase [Bacteroidales bacterium]|nr:NUDIX hydrolase [Bacteroidales bacterium]